MTRISDIIHDIAANPAPVLFLDTCILLDVVRAPLRSKPDEVRFAQLFLTSVQKNPKTPLDVGDRVWTDDYSSIVRHLVLRPRGERRLKAGSPPRSPPG